MVAVFVSGSDFLLLERDVLAFFSGRAAEVEVEASVPGAFPAASDEGLSILGPGFRVETYSSPRFRVQTVQLHASLQHGQTNVVDASSNPISGYLEQNEKSN